MSSQLFALNPILLSKV